MSKEKKIAVISIVIIITLTAISGIGLCSISDSISILSQETQILQNMLNNKKNNLKDINTQMTETKNEINLVKKSLEETIVELEKLQSGTRYVLEDLSYWNIKNFLTTDKTNKKPYDEENFNCVHYAQEVNNNAEKKGLRCGYVALNFSDNDVGHALIAFNSIDRGIVYFEPQNDYEVKLQVGKHYWADCVVPPSGYYYEREPGFTIKEFEIFW